MSNPLITIVDELDQPIGTAYSREARLRGQWHRVVRVIVEDANGRLLLQLRASKLSVFPDCWDTAASGQVDAGETYTEAAARELREEVGIEATPHEIGYYRSEYQTESQYGLQTLRRFNRVYRARVPRGIATSLQAGEVAETKWCTLEEVRQLLREQPDRVTDGLSYVINKYY